MKKLLFLGSSFLLSLFFLVSSCTKDETLVVGKTEVTVKDGMLHFKDIKQFSEMYKYLIEDFSRLKQVENMDFLCVKEAFRSTTALNIDKPFAESQINSHVAYWQKDAIGEHMLLRLISNPAYEVMFNENALVNIGGQIYKHGKDAIYIFDPRYLSMLDDVKNIPGVQILHKSGDVAVEKYTAECTSVYAYKNGNQWKKVRGRIGPEIELIGNCWCATGYFFYTTDNLKRGLFGSWGASDANQVRVTGLNFDYFQINTDSVTYRYGGNETCNHSTIDDSDSGSCNN
ncbi:hypothetical protein [Haliscomenobacter sp.]|uniref:hypothetical protein n=1 Tax=Haliscomenobacter sp. TaxID=2717303 RepID=UPI0035943565